MRDVTWIRRITRILSGLFLWLVFIWGLDRFFNWLSIPRGETRSTILGIVSIAYIIWFSRVYDRAYGLGWWFNWESEVEGELAIRKERKTRFIKKPLSFSPVSYIPEGMISIHDCEDCPFFGYKRDSDDIFQSSCGYYLSVNMGNSYESKPSFCSVKGFEIYMNKRKHKKLMEKKIGIIEIKGLTRCEECPFLRYKKNTDDTYQAFCWLYTQADMSKCSLAIGRPWFCLVEGIKVYV